MSSETTQNEGSRLSGWKLAGLAALPVAVMAGVIALFLATSGAGLHAESTAPIEALSFERTELHPGLIAITVRNMSPQDVTIAAVNINDAIWPFHASPAPVIPRLSESTVKLDYPWVEGEAYSIKLISTNSVGFSTRIDAAAETTPPGSGTLVSYLLIGLYVGVIPVFLGMFWLPALRRLGPRWMTFLMAITVGLLVFLGIDAANEGLELAAELGGAFQGVGLMGIGGIVTFLLLDTIGRRQAQIGRSESEQRIALAFMIAVGIGLHNLGEGLAIGASYSQGALALGTFLVIGFIIQNVTEGLGIVIPILKDRPSLRDLALLGVIGGGPAIAGALIGGLIYSKILAVLFLGIGAGAVFEVVYEVGKLIQRDAARRPMPGTIFTGVTAGMLVLYAIGVVVK